MTDSQRRNRKRNERGRRMKYKNIPMNSTRSEDEKWAIDTKRMTEIKSIPYEDINRMDAFQLTTLAEALQRQLRNRFRLLEKAEKEEGLYSHAMYSFKASFEEKDITVSRTNPITGERENVMYHVKPDFRMFARLRNRKERVQAESEGREVAKPTKTVGELRHFITKARQFFSADTATPEGIRRVNAAQDEWLFSPTGTLHHLTISQRKEFWALIDKFAAKYERDYYGFMYLAALNAAATFWVDQGGVIRDTDSAVDAIHKIVANEFPDPLDEEGVIDDPFSTGMIGRERRI